MAIVSHAVAKIKAYAHQEYNREDMLNEVLFVFGMRNEV
jgi:hypothetical protein